MKRTLFAVAALACVAIAPVTRATDVSVDFFYTNLSGGSWIDVGDYGYCWQPDVAVNDAKWRPYSDGYWAYTDLGWTWVSYEDFGWATYHYGRWARLSDYGWVWVPGRNEDLEWGPAWVSWRTGGEYVGWAPLPPETVVYEGRPVTGHIDIEFNIGPACYNFVDVRYIGAPVLRERIVAPAQNVTYINQTVNVTNITYKNKVVYNYGPDVNVINQHAERPIQRLKIERQENVDVTAAAKSGGLVKPQGDKLVVAAPMLIHKAQNDVAPQTVKTKVANADVDRGWALAGDEKAQSDLKEKIKTQDLKKIPPFGAAAGGASANTETSADASLKGKRGKRSDQESEQNPPAIGPQSKGAATGTAQNDSDMPRGGKKGKRAQHGDGNVSSTGKALINKSPNEGQVQVPQREGKGKHPGKNKPEESPASAPPQQ